MNIYSEEYEWKRECDKIVLVLMGIVLLVGSPSFVFAAESEKTSDSVRNKMVEKFDLTLRK